MIHINRFIDKVKAAESRHERGVNLTIQEAKDLHADITKLLLAMQELTEHKKDGGDIQNIEISGVDW